MGMKSKMRSMQRGAYLRNRGRPDPTPDYANFDPWLREGEELHFGVAGEQRDAFLRKINPIVEALEKAGFTKPAAISRELNKQKRRTFLGEFWSPRLCWFLKKELHEFRKRERQRVQKARKQKHGTATRRMEQGKISNPGNLTSEELQRRRAALEAFIKGDRTP